MTTWPVLLRVISIGLKVQVKSCSTPSRRIELMKAAMMESLIVALTCRKPTPHILGSLSISITAASENMDVFRPPRPPRAS